MNVHDAIRTRRTIHRFLRDPVPIDVVRRAVEGALLAPNHRLTEPWRFTLLGRRAREPMAELSVRIRRERADEEPPAEALERIRAKVLDPPWGLLVQCLHSDDPFRLREDRAAVACALQNLFLSLHAEGIGSKWSSGAAVRHPELPALLGVKAEGLDVLGMVWIGRAADVPAPPTRAASTAVYREIVDE